MRYQAFFFFLAGCSTLPARELPVDAALPSPPDASVPDAFDTAPPPAGTVRFQMALTVPPGTETHKCQMVRMPQEAGVVVRMAHHYTTGSHHLLLFRTDLSNIPAGLDQLVDCYEGQRSVMSYVRGIYYGSQIPDDSAGLPDDVGLAYRAGEIFLFQSHYINATDKPIDAHVTVDLATTSAASRSKRAGVLFFYDPFISVPARSMAQAQMRCAIPSDIRIEHAFSHYHRRGVQFEAFLDGSPGVVADTPFYTSSDWEHPAPLTKPIDVKGGSSLRFTCDYDNRDSDNSYFQGESAENNEMCIFSALYYPALGTDAEWCLIQPDMFGTGSSSCALTLLCLAGCQQGGPPPIGSGGPVAVDPCLQSCVVSSCPNASGLILGGLSCLENYCLGACAQGGAQCVQCLQTHCPTELNTCLNTPCQ